MIVVMIINSLPFVGFGFLDNFTMIIAVSTGFSFKSLPNFLTVWFLNLTQGDYIEHTIGFVVTISTMAAAALGNTISDIIGIGSAYYVERGAEIVGIKPPPLTPIQLEMESSRRAANFVSYLIASITIIVFHVWCLSTHNSPNCLKFTLIWKVCVTLIHLHSTRRVVKTLIITSTVVQTQHSNYHPLVGH